MANQKKSNSIAVTFSKKNYDVRDIIFEKKKDDTIVITDYICECIRFYEKNKDTLSVDAKIQNAINKAVSDMVMSKKIFINQETEVSEDIKEDVKNNIKNLEDIDNDTRRILNFDDD